MFRKDFLESKARERIVAHLTDGQSLRGVLLAIHRDCIVLGSAEALAEGVTAAIDGEALVPRERVAWLQLLRAEAG